ncbi:MAG: uroporphyrinogen decarboxylase family protein [Desulfopila sp.]
MRRIQEAMQQRVADQLPFTLNVNGPFFSYYCGICANDYYGSSQVMLNAQLAVYHRFGRVTTISPEMSLAPEASALGGTINWSEDGTAWVEPFIHTESDVDNLTLPDLDDAGYMTRIFDYYAFMAKKLAGSGIPITLGSANSPFTIAALVRGTSEFIGDLVLNPRFARKLLRKVTDLVLMYLRHQQKISPPESFTRILLFDDLSGFVNLELFRQYVLPIYREIYQAFPDCQRWYHNDSDTTHILEAIAEAGIQMFHYGYQVDPAHIKKVIGDRVCLMGSVTPLEVLRNGTPEAVTKEVREIIQKAGHGGGLVVAAGGYIDEGTPIENIEAMLRATALYGQKEQILSLEPYVESSVATTGAPKPAETAEEIVAAHAQFPILARIEQAVIVGNLAEIEQLVQDAIDEGISAQQILDTSVITGMDRVGSLFSQGEIFIPEMMMAAKCTKLGMAHLTPLLAQNDGKKKSRGKIAIGTVMGDLHDIGKDIVISMMQGAGLVVEDLDVDCPPERFCEAVENGAELIGMSAILTTVIPNMQRTVEMLKTRGLRDRCKVLIGGAAVTPMVVDEVGADAYCVDAGQGVKIAKELLGR